MQHNHQDYQHAAHQQFICIVRNNDAHRYSYCYGGEGWQVGSHILCHLGKEMLAEQTKDNRCYHHIDNAQQHANGIYLDHRSRHQPDQQGGE